MLKHLAVIMDGNRRWAQKHNLSVYEGYQAGAEALKEAIKFCLKKNIRCLTTYAFSSENWGRSLQEIAYIMDIGVGWIKNNLDFFHENAIRLSLIGNRFLIPNDFLVQIEEVEEETKKHDALRFNVALSYGSRDEIVRAIVKMISDKTIVTEDTVASYLDTGNLPDPDLLIRAGGEKRLSNYLLWQLAYTELCFVDNFWPDVDFKQLSSIVDQYHCSKRNFGI